MFLKNVFDRVGAFFGLLLCSPLLLAIAIMIKVKMPGPILFVQKRVGKGARLFNMYKFRSMVLHHSGSTISVKGESRITPFGRTLRKYKLDELPELWNILIGDMSFVGPRPDVQGYADELAGEDKIILSVRPGITGLASLKYRNEEVILATQDNPQWYNDHVIYPDKIKLNKYYINNISFMLDMKIILCTMLGRDGKQLYEHL